MASKHIRPLGDLSASCMGYLHEIRVRGQAIYLAVLLAAVALLASLPFIYVDVNVRGNGMLQAAVVGDLPDTTLVGVVGLPAKDAGLVWRGQAVRIQVDAFDHHQWGRVDATVSHIAEDLVLDASGRPVLPITCALDRTHLTLSNGYRGYLKKGMPFRARLLISRRSLFQLLSDRVDDWLDPNANAYEHHYR